jgi:hypothetical protein
MADQRDTQQSAYLHRVSADLSRSLRRCHVLVDDYRAHLKPANSNDTPFILREADQAGEQDDS